MAPAHAILVWADDLNIYCAPQKQPDRDIAFPKSENGLHRALSILNAEHLANPEPYERTQVEPHALTKQNLTLEDLAAAAKALKDLGIIR